MRIESDTTPYSGEQLNHSHHHHITKCLHEEKSTKLAGKAAGISKDTYKASDIAFQEEKGSETGIGLSTSAKPGKAKLGLGLVKGMWDSLGDEGDVSAREGVSPMHDKLQHLQGVKAAISGIRQNLSYYIVNKWEAVRERIKVSTNSLLKRFGKNHDSFSMFSDAGHFTRGQKNDESWKREEKQGAGREDEKIPSIYQSDSHLMDSYSKTGEYCKLNENLTYRKKSSSGKN
ncbi:MAG: hypothetical protein Q4D94_04845 [Bacillota bacterium]|nr:hypothetical protein [Bacillota bacterium]